MDGRIAHPLFDKFKADGYVIAASGSHKAGFKSSGKPPWVPASGPVLEKMLDEYFDPIMEVERYVSHHARGIVASTNNSTVLGLRGQTILARR